MSDVQPQTTTPVEDAPAPAPQTQGGEDPAPAPQTTAATAPQDEPAPAPQDEPAPAPQTTAAPAPDQQPQQDEPAPAPQTTAAPVADQVADQGGVQIADPNAGSDPAPAPQVQPSDQVSPCGGGDMGACAALADSDSPPAYLTASFVPGTSPNGADFISQCLGLANYARAHYSGAAPLAWNADAAAAAQRAADYSATNECGECHTESGPGYSWGQNLYYTSVGCYESYNGWVTNEARGADPSNPDAGHFKNVVGTALSWSQYSSIGCAVSTIGSGATVCNYAL